MSYQMRKFVSVWSLRRGVLDPPEPLSERNNLLANISQLSRELQQSKRALRWIEAIPTGRRKAA